MKKTKTGALTNPKTVIFATQLLRCKVDIAISAREMLAQQKLGQKIRERFF